MSTAAAPRRTRKRPGHDLTIETPKGYELIDGRLQETRVSAESNAIASEIHGRLWQYCHETGIGRAFAADSAYRCFPGRPLHSRKPDVSFISKGRYPHVPAGPGDIAVAPDFIVEVVSPKDWGQDIQTRVREFQSVGTRLIWVIYPATREVLVYRPDSVRELGENDELDGEDVLPGFRFKLADVLLPAIK